MANSDSPTNMLWLINQATAGGDPSQPGTAARSTTEADVTAPRPSLANAGLGMDFTNIKIDVTANR